MAGPDAPNSGLSLDSLQRNKMAHGGEFHRLGTSLYIYLFSYTPSQFSFAASGPSLPLAFDPWLFDFFLSPSFYYP